MRDLGLEPVDMRLRKPVLTNSRDVLERGGVEQASAVRDLLSRLPDSASVADLARAVGVTPPAALGEGGLTVAELPIPGTGVSIPLSVDLTGTGGLP